MIEIVQDEISTDVAGPLLNGVGDLLETLKALPTGPEPLGSDGVTVEKIALARRAPEETHRTPRYGGATASMESLHQHQGQNTLRRLHTLERRASPTKTKRPWSGPQITPRSISEHHFRSHHPSSDLRKKRLEHFRADGTTRRLSRQPTLGGRSRAQRSVVSFSLCRPTEAQQPFHFKRREPFSRHQRSHHLLWQVL